MIVYLRLALAYFCQFAIWGSWAVALGAYAGGVLNFDKVGLLFNAIPIGALIAPLFIGPIADRYFSAQKVMSVLHFIGGLALIACGALCASGMATFPVLMGLMLLSGICYMPTMGLINSVVFKHLPSAGMGPYVFVWGTIGWITVNLCIAGFCGGAKTPNFFFVGGGVSIFLALYSLTLPNTPPKGAPAPGEKSSGGLAVLSLFGNIPFAIFVFCVFLASIPACNYFFPAQGLFLSERGYDPVTLGTLNQFSEIALMLALPFCVARFGLKKVLLIGMAAWSIRYFCFAEPYFSLLLVGLLLHGFCYSFLYVAAYMYAEKVAPTHLKASAQSMMVFLLLGVGQILGGFGYDFMRDGRLGVDVKPKFAAIAVEGTQLDPLPAGIDATNKLMVPIPAWSEADDSLFQYLDLGGLVQKWLGKTHEENEGEDVARTVDLGKLLGEKSLTSAELDAIFKPLEKEDGTVQLVQLWHDGVEISKTSTCCTPNVKAFEAFVASVEYTKEDLKALAKDIAGKEDFSLSRSDWLAAQAHDWRKIWQLPALCILGCFLIFFLLGRDPKDKAEAPK